MKKLFWFLAAFVMLVSCQTGGEEPETLTLTDEEKEDLLFLREEEKLARDVYLYAYEKYGLRIFQNISGSEQNHMNMVLALLIKYELEDPASPEVGVFNNPELQTLYDELTALVDQSETDALIVGATIEDLDINDIHTFQERTEKLDLLDVYGKLECGSRNHLRSYYGELVNRDVTYSPQFISQEEFDEIVNSPHERCGNQ